MIKLISLVICTHNRATQLRNCLSSLLVLRAPCEWELLLVDNASTDGTRAVVEEFAVAAPFQVRYLHEPAAGLSRARNTGLAAARGDLVLFTDDDCYPEPDFLVSSMEVLSTGEVDYFGGRVLLHDPTDAPVTIKTSTEVELIAPHSFVRAGMIHGANMGICRHVMEEIGGFNEALGAGSVLKGGEDVEYLARASAAGFKGGYFPGPTVRHHHGRKEADIGGQYWGYNIGRGAYYASMILHTGSRALFLREWLASLTWRHPRKGLGEVLGSVRFWLIYLNARIAGRSLIPRMGPRV